VQIVPQFTPNSPLTIVQRDDAFPDYPFERLNHHLLAEIRAGYATLPLSLRGIQTVQPRHLECVLQICGIHVPNAGFASAEFWRGCVAYVGAVNSQKFIDATHAWRHRQTTNLPPALLCGMRRRSDSSPDVWSRAACLRSRPRCLRRPNGPRQGRRPRF